MGHEKATTRHEANGPFFWANRGVSGRSPVAAGYVAGVLLRLAAPLSSHLRRIPAAAAVLLNIIEIKCPASMRLPFGRAVALSPDIVPICPDGPSSPPAWTFEFSAGDGNKPDGDAGGRGFRPGAWGGRCAWTWGRAGRLLIKHRVNSGCSGREPWDIGLMGANRSEQNSCVYRRL